MKIKFLIMTGVLAVAILVYWRIAKVQATDNSALIAQINAQTAQLFAQLQANPTDAAVIAQIQTQLQTNPITATTIAAIRAEIAQLATQLQSNSTDAALISEIGNEAAQLQTNTSGTSDTSITASCSASPSSVVAGTPITWTAIAGGGNGVYTYSWSGTNSLSGTASSYQRHIQPRAQKRATIAVTSNGISKTANCYATVSENIQAEIACIGAAVATREAAIDSAITTHAASVNSAYSARTSALATAYSTQTTTATVKSAVKVAWSTFSSTSLKTARKTWQTARNAAWAQYRITGTACKAPSGTGDGSYSGNEMSGQ